MDTSRADMTEPSTEDNASLLNSFLDSAEIDSEAWEAGGKLMTLSEHVLRSLDITTGKGSLYDLLNKRCSPRGSRLLLKWLSRPLLDVQEIENRLDLVENFIKKPSTLRTVADVHLKKFPDFAPVVRKLERKTAALQDLYRTYCAIQRIPDLVEALKCDADLVPDRINRLVAERFSGPLTRAFGDFRDYQQLIPETIDIAHLTRTGEYRIKPALTPDLLESAKQMESLESQMEEDWDSLRAEAGETGNAIKFERDHRLGYLYRVTRKDEKLLRETGLSLVTVDTKTAGYRFRTSELAHLNAQYLALATRYGKLQTTVITELVATAASYSEPLKSLNNVLAPLDVIVALAQTAWGSSIPYVRPTILSKETGVIELIESRHPCIESFCGRDFIPNSVRFEQNKETFHIVTGPNMGGKSTYIRQVALNVILAQMGSFVPCKSAIVSLVDGVFTRIGAGDSVTKGVSTFMMEMLEIQDILKVASQYSLIIIDELGRGTSTFDGYGLAYAVSESIANDLGAYCMLTTHFNELADLKNSAKNVVLSHVAALVLEEGITFQYAVEPGVCSQSFGINVAQMAGLPSPVIEDAKKILSELENAHRRGMAATAAAV